jgi:dTDP-4-amino-4,6-dideoxygalactose transaminase
MSAPDITPEDIATVTAVLRSKVLSLGPFLSRFERAFARYIGAEPTSRLSWFAYIIHLAPDIDRDRVIAQLERRNIPSRVYFSPIHLQPLYRERFGYREGDFPVAERVAASTLALPFHSNMPEENIEYVAATLATAVVRAAA